MTAQDDIAFLFDCDNTLLDNDCVKEDLQTHLEREFRVAARDCYKEVLQD